MARRPGISGNPSSYVAEGGTWPAGPFVDDTPVSVYYAADVAAALSVALKDAGVTQVALQQDLGLARSTTNAILKGRAMADFHVIATLESHLGVSLWPQDGHSRHHHGAPSH